MKKLLIICFGYDSENSSNPNSLCLYEIIGALSKTFDITLITSTENSMQFKKVSSNIEIYYIPIQKNVKYNFTEWKKEILYFIKKSYRKRMIETNAMLTISFPFDTLEMGYKIKKLYPHIRWYIYELDPYAYNLVLRFPKILFYYRFFKEFRVFKLADCIMLTHELYKQYSENKFSIFKSKFKDIGIPLMTINPHNKLNKNSDSKINFIYIGSFYEKVREPDYMLNTLLNVSKNINGIQLHLYGPDPREIKNEIRKEFGNKLFVHGRVSKEKVLQVIHEADIFVNIGNTVNNQLPSKVLEYIGTGKPIISFYSVEDDTSNRYLRNYPNSLLIKEEKKLIKQNVIKIIRFIKSNKNIILSRAEILRNFSEDTSEHISNKIVNSLMD